MGSHGEGRSEKDPRCLTVFEQMNAVSSAEILKRRNHPAATRSFNIFVGAVVVLNAVFIGLEVDLGRGDAIEDRVPFFILECVCSLVFIVEMLFRMHQLKWDYFLDPWNVLDYALVVLSLLDLSASLSSDQGSKMGATLRVVRLLRIVRNIRLLRLFQQLWLLVRGLFD